MKKYQLIFDVEANHTLSPSTNLLRLRPTSGELPEMLPGQFVNVLPPASSGKLLRRPISICDVKDGCLFLLVKRAGAATNAICDIAPGDSLDILLPLGKGFTVPDRNEGHYLLVGGGVGIAPLLYLGRHLRNTGSEVSFLLGGRTSSDLVLLSEFAAVGHLFITTEDASSGVKGLVTDSPAISGQYDMIFCCGPKPMMKAVGDMAKAKKTECEVSLENNMACGIGACLCCVQDTKDKGNTCVCKEGPVFNYNEIKW